MQRRAAAVSVAVLLLLSAGSYAAIGFVEEPTVSVDGPHELRAGDSFTGTDGQTYVASAAGDGSATFAWTVQSSTYTAEWANGSEVTYDNGTWVVDIPGESPEQFTLREVQDVAAILAADDAVANETVSIDGTPHVDYLENDSYVPLAEYLPAKETVTVDAGATFQYAGNETTVTDLTADAATLTWTAPRQMTAEAEDGGNVTLDRQYLAHFPGDGSVVLTTNFAAYQEEVDRANYFNERVNGLWAVSILTGLTAILLVGMAYLPSRY